MAKDTLQMAAELVVQVLAVSVSTPITKPSNCPRTWLLVASVLVPWEPILAVDDTEDHRDVLAVTKITLKQLERIFAVRDAEDEEDILLHER
ncbi:hypothetical protein BGZ96_011468 [Linnemannia gamsii]|uniref:Uncharacterized protein n=1 Tax=Linnemannia gamsii TaxID=64522 RepID=A0ABQ7JSK9_9FUNG|nr:hypothetical protein BGZ96_011468 [Linnemannia gamsii]